MASTVIENIGLLATPIGKSARSGREQGEIRLLQNAYLCYEDKLFSPLVICITKSMPMVLPLHL